MKFSDGQWLELSRLLDEALALPAAERNAWLEKLPPSAGDLGPTLREILSREALGETNAFLKTLPKLAAPLAATDRIRLREGAIVGPYRLLRQIGRGGMGSVWLAERTDGVLKRAVALKLPHSGAYGPQLAERFARERDILAALSHPHIARLYDAGVSADDQPFLALEYVDGEPLAKYCDRLRLELSQRLALFLQVLDAVQYAHARLVVHRDLKPSNILVENDEVHLLDFGIAKLVADEPVPESDLTQAVGRLLTPDYASPEQIAGVPLTTATDVYSLGVILYELCTGERPYRLKRDSRGALEDAILEAEVMRPSAACRDPEKAALRGLSVVKLHKTLRGDLDIIILKALKKSPAERYASVTALADDLRRALSNQPISARADSAPYRLGKFARRHTTGLSATAAMVVVIAGLVSFYTAQLASERDRARLEAQKAISVSNLLTGLLTGADPYDENAQRKEPTVRGILDAGADRIEKELASQPDVQAEMLTVMGRVYQRLALHVKAQSLLEKGLEAGRRAFGPEHERVAQSLNELGVLLRERGEYAAAASILEQALAMRRKVLGREHEDVAVTLVEVGRVYMDLGRDDLAEPLFRESLAIRKKVLGEEDHETGTSLSDLAFLAWRRGDLANAESLYRQCLVIYRKSRGDDHPNVATILDHLGSIAAERQDYAAAESMLQESLAITRKALGERHPDVAKTLDSISTVLRQQGKYEEAESFSRDALQMTRSALGDDHRLLARFGLNLARVQLLRNEAPSAEPMLRKAVEIREHAYPAGNWRIGEAKGVLGECLTAQGRYDEAEALLLEAHRLLKEGPGWEGQEAKATRLRLAALYEAWGQPQKAAAYLSERQPS
jgi:serine/threonine protein kinase/Tfp pilus assembly protein PilF